MMRFWMRGQRLYRRRVGFMVFMLGNTTLTIFKISSVELGVGFHKSIEWKQAMHLLRLQITNFRGISQIDLSLERERTALFGENNWGKTSLISALTRCLSEAVPLDALFTHEDFHRVANTRATIARRLNITLFFCGASDEPLPDPALQDLSWQDDEGRPWLALRFSAERYGHGEVRSHRSFIDAQGAERQHAASDELAVLLIRHHPVLRFRDMQLTDWLEHPRLAQKNRSEDPPQPASAAVRAVFERILTLPHQLHPQELTQGLDAVEQFLSEHAELLQAPVPLQRLAKQIASTPFNLRDDDSLLDIAGRAGSSQRRVALLMLLGALINARGDLPLQQGAHPILLMEDPETHLHPIQLAMMWGLIEQLPLQKLITTNHGDLLASFPHQALRRLVRRHQHVHVYQVGEQALSASDARKVAFHIRANRASSMFARVWLLVEGETEFWLMPELARIYGVNFPVEGIRCVEFAQAGLTPLIKFADRLGIVWHLIADGDEAGQRYIAKARSLLNDRPDALHITALASRDIEHYLWDNGFADTYRNAAKPRGPLNHWHQAAMDAAPPRPDEEIIQRALRFHSKPGMALEIAEAAEIAGAEAIPQELQQMFDTLQQLASYSE